MTSGYDCLFSSRRGEMELKQQGLQPTRPYHPFLLFIQPTVLSWFFDLAFLSLFKSKDIYLESWYWRSGKSGVKETYSFSYSLFYDIGLIWIFDML